MTAPSSPASASGTGGPIPHLGFDPFSIEFFADPFRGHEKLREAGPLVYLDRWGVYGVARYAEVHAVLNDPLTFCSSRGVGLSDFAKEKPWRPPMPASMASWCVSQTDKPKQISSRGEAMKAFCADQIGRRAVGTLPLSYSEASDC